MAVGVVSPEELLPVAGIRLGTVAAGISKPDRRDLVVLELAEGTGVSAVFTRNRFCAAPVQVAREHLAADAVRYLLINTGNANAGTGARGLRNAMTCCEALAEAAGCAVHAVMPFSTGVIGEPLPVDRITSALPAALDALCTDGWLEAAKGILTTDTVAKGVSRRVSLSAGAVTITGIAKGAGMIRPDMATMLSFVATDVALAPELREQSLREAVNLSFNRITVDGDTSTNDACVLAASGASGVYLGADDNDYRTFVEALSEVCTQLAQAVVRDGEGATRFITIRVEQGAAVAECEAIAYTIAHSPLVKTAFFAGDPNWGRILAAVGRAGIDGLDVDRVRIWLDELCLAEEGGRAEAYSEETATELMAGEEVTIRVVLGRGEAVATIWTCDFSYEYVRINAEYRT